MKAREQGKLDYAKGKDQDANPFRKVEEQNLFGTTPVDPRASEWHEGWCDAQEERTKNR